MPNPDTIESPGIEIAEEVSDALDDPWNVIVYDDPVNLMTYVTLILKRVFGYSEDLATKLMLEVHEQGKSIVWTGVREKAELYVQELQGYQLLAAMKRVS